MSAPPPALRLDPRALPMWRIDEGLQSLVAIVLGAAVSAALLIWTDLSVVVALLPLVAFVLLGVASILWIPRIRYRHWRYEIGATEVDLQHGVLTITRVRVPMARIQHVDTRRGPLERRFGLATVVLYTAAGANLIPGLAVETADAVRDQIAALANTRDDV